MHKTYQIIKEIIKLPKVKISFKDYNEHNELNYKKMYNYFISPHPRYKIFGKKTIGIGLIDFQKFSNFNEYGKTINGKNSALYYSRKALKRGYYFLEIDRNNYIDDIYKINTSATERQGSKMSEGYLKKIDFYKNEPDFRYFGVLDENGNLVAYCNIGVYGEFGSIDSLLGHKEHLNNGVMYFMIIEVVKLFMEESSTTSMRYLMYDTFFGASEGLKKFKIKLGFVPYKVKWLWEK